MNTRGCEDLRGHFRKRSPSRGLPEGGGAASRGGGGGSRGKNKNKNKKHQTLDGKNSSEFLSRNFSSWTTIRIKSDFSFGFQSEELTFLPCGRRGGYFLALQLNPNSVMMSAMACLRCRPKRWESFGRERENNSVTARRCPRANPLPCHLTPTRSYRSFSCRVSKSWPHALTTKLHAPGEMRRVLTEVTGWGAFLMPRRQILQKAQEVNGFQSPL